MSQEADRAEPPPAGGFSSPAAQPSDGVTLGVFAKHWAPGATKTRLAASIGQRAAAEASRCFLEATIQRLATLRLAASRRVLAYSPAHQGAAFLQLAEALGDDWQVTPQSEGDLGARMQSYFESALESTRSALLVGSDSPHLPIAAVVEAAAWLDEPGDMSRLVLGPTDDGGYWLIGARGTLPPIFKDMPWSDPGLLEATLACLHADGRREGTDYRLAPLWYDIDDLDDLNRLRRESFGPDAGPLARLAARLDELLGPMAG